MLKHYNINSLTHTTIMANVLKFSEFIEPSGFCLLHVRVNWVFSIESMFFFYVYALSQALYFFFFRCCNMYWTGVCAPKADSDFLSTFFLFLHFALHAYNMNIVFMTIAISRFFIPFRFKVKEIFVWSPWLHVMSLYFFFFIILSRFPKFIKRYNLSSECYV